MNISRVVTLSLALAVAVFALGYVNPASAVKPGANCDPKIPLPIHPSCPKEDPVPDPIEDCTPSMSPCIVSVGKSLRRAAADYVVDKGTYTVMSSQRFGELLGAIPEASSKATDLCKAFDVVIVEWSNPKIKNLTWERLKKYMACGGGIIFEDPRNVEALAPGVSTLEINFKSTDDQPISLLVDPVCILTLGPPLNTTDCNPLPGAFNLDVVNQHMTFDMVKSDSVLMRFLALAVSADVVGIYGKFGAGGIVVTGPDNSFHGNLIPIPDLSDEINAARANQHKLLHNEINWLLSL